MAKIIVNPTSSSRREIALPRTLLSIGRDPGNDLVLPDAMVSRRHAVIELRGSQYFIRDCNSSNGSLVNGDRVNERSLRDGDLVAIGTARLLFRDDLDVEAGGKVVQHPSAPRLNCPACGADHRKGDQFCRQCGGALAPSLPPKAVCASCGTAVLLPARFCTACGGAIAVAPGDAAPPSDAGAVEPAPPPPPAPEVIASPKRFVSMEPPTALPSVPDRPLVQVDPRPEEVKARRPGTPGEASVPPRSVPPSSREVPSRPPLAPPRATKFPDTFRERQEAASSSEPAGAGRRLVAAMLDHAIIGLVQGAVLAPVLWYWWSRPIPSEASQVPFAPVAVSVALVPVAIVLGCLYFIYGWGVRGATPGKGLLGIAVEGQDGAYPIGASRAAVRLLGYLLSGALLGIGYAMVLFGGRGLHDRIAGTRVMPRRRI
jgi:uncharacterized RDD family membrane protein YckC